MNMLKKNEEAVSPVIGVILMVAITVVLAATIAMFVMGETDKLDGTEKFVAVQGSASGTQVTVELRGGADIAELAALNFTFDSAPVTKATVNGEEKTLTTGKLGSTDLNAKSFQAGDTFRIENAGGVFKAVGIFADGTEQILYTKTFPKKS